jgi:acetyl-CoA carboxylase biotin carboxyl carrier protein
MDYNLIKKLVKIVEQSNVTEFSVQEGDLKIKISKNGKQQTINTVVAQPAAQQVQAPAVAPNQSEVKPQVNENQAAANPNHHEVCSPIVGTFYRAPSPDSEPYVKVGDTVSEGTVLCIVEAMKLMNEIESDVNGKIVKILVDNATPVEYNQPLFIIEKS